MFKGNELSYNWDSAIGILEDDIFKNKASQNCVLGSLGVKNRISSKADCRKEPRFSMSLPVKHRLNGFWNRFQLAKSVNISQNGIRLALGTSVPIGAPIDLRIKLPNSKRHIQMQGLVVWQQPSPNGKSHMECGVAFQSLRKQSKKEKIIEFMSNRLCRLALQAGSGFTASLARTQEDLIEAYSLIYQEYFIKGYCPENDAKLYYNHRCVTPGSQTFLIRNGKRLIGTVSLILDSPCGLPMEALFKDKIRFFRRPGRVLAEVSMLAMDRHFFGRGSFSLTNLKKLSASFHLFKILFDYARIELGVTDILITMHPKHKELYQYLSFRTFGPVRSYSSVQGKPALPMRLDIPHVLMSVPWDDVTRAYFIDKVTPSDVLKSRYQWTHESIRDFLVTKQSLWTQIDPGHQKYLCECYPELADDETRT